VWDKFRIKTQNCKTPADLAQQLVWFSRQILPRVLRANWTTSENSPATALIAWRAQCAQCQEVCIYLSIYLFIYLSTYIHTYIHKHTRTQIWNLSHTILSLSLSLSLSRARARALSLSLSHTHTHSRIMQEGEVLAALKEFESLSLARSRAPVLSVSLTHIHFTGGGSTGSAEGV
jgi:hypothetical protein